MVVVHVYSAGLAFGQQGVTLLYKICLARKCWTGFGRTPSKNLGLQPNLERLLCTPLDRYSPRTSDLALYLGYSILRGLLDKRFIHPCSPQTVLRGVPKKQFWTSPLRMCWTAQSFFFCTGRANDRIRHDHDVREAAWPRPTAAPRARRSSSLYIFEVHNILTRRNQRGLRARPSASPARSYCEESYTFFKCCVVVCCAHSSPKWLSHARGGENGGVTTSLPCSL